jgi:hypothetical protein
LHWRINIELSGLMEGAPSLDGPMTTIKKGTFFYREGRGRTMSRIAQKVPIASFLFYTD